MNQLSDSKSKVRLVLAERARNKDLNNKNHQLKDELISVNRKMVGYVETIRVLQADVHNLCNNKRN